MKKSLLLLVLSCWVILGFSQAFKPGDKIEDFKLKNVDGKMVSLANYPDAKGFIIVFTCNLCPYAQAYENRVIELDKQFAGKGYPVIAIDPNDAQTFAEESFENMQKQALEKKYTFPYLCDDTQQLAKKFGATKAPQVFVVEKTKTGYIVRYTGAVDNDVIGNDPEKEKYVEWAVNALLNNELPKITITKAIGCGFKLRS